MNPSDLQRFWDKVDKKAGFSDNLDSRCWEWTGARTRDGYGRFKIDGKAVFAHRLSFLLATGLEPEQVLHKCNNRSCVRPLHLAAGDSKDNFIDLLLRRIQESE